MKKFNLLSHLFCLLLTTAIFAQTNTWTGTVDRDWHKACNWSLNQIPTCSHDVLIPNTTNKPFITGTAHSKTINVASASGAFLEVESSGSGIVYVSSTNGGACGGIATNNGGCCTTSEWQKTSCPSTNANETANDLAIDDNYMYVVGSDGALGLGRQQWRIEKRNLSDGNLVTAFDGDGILQFDPQSGNPDVPLAINLDASGIFICGYYIAHPCCFTTGWRIEKRNATTGALMTAFNGSGAITYNIGDQYSNETAYDLVSDGTRLYVVGQEPGNGNRWRMICYNATTGAQVWSQLSDPSSGSDIARAVAVDASGVYIGGSDNTPGNEQWRIEKRNLTTGALIAAFGGSGAVVSNPTSSIDQLNDIAVDATGIYAVGYDNVPGNAEWRIEKRDLTTGALITTFGTNGVVTINPTTGFEVAHGVSVYNGRLHVVGTGSNGWRTSVLDAATGAELCATDPGTSTAYKVKANASGSFAVGGDPGCTAQWKMMKLCNCP